MSKVNVRDMLGRFQIIGMRPDGSELVLWSEDERAAAERQMALFTAHLEGYQSLRVDEVAQSFWRP